MKRTPRHILVVIPAFNEQDSVAAVVREIQQTLPSSQVLVVDDGSTDSTRDVALGSGAKVISMPFNVGVGGALRAGLLVGHRSGADVVVHCDADGQHPPSAIPDLITATSNFDIAIGARFAGVGDYEVRGPRRWAMKLLAAAISKVHHTQLTDVTSGFRAFSPRAVSVLSRELPPDYLSDTVEALILAKEHGLRVGQIPVKMRSRQAGTPSQAPLKAALYLARALVILGLSLLRFLRPRNRRSRP